MREKNGVHLSLVPDMRSVLGPCWASLGMRISVWHLSMTLSSSAASEPAVHSAGCRRMWVLVGANAVAPGWELRGRSLTLMKVFAVDLVKIALFVEFLVSNL